MTDGALNKYIISNFWQSLVRQYELRSASACTVLGMLKSKSKRRLAYFQKLCVANGLRVVADIWSGARIDG